MQHDTDTMPGTGSGTAHEADAAGRAAGPEGLVAALAAIKQRRPAYGALVDLFTALLREQAVLAETFAAEAPTPELPDPERWRQGVFLLADVDLSAHAEPLGRAFDALLPVLGASFGLEREMDVLRAARAGQQESAAKGGSTATDATAPQPDLPLLAHACLDGHAKPLEDAGAALGVEPSTLALAVRSALAPVLAGWARANGPRFAARNWTQGYCPFCGSPPAVATLSRIENPRGENLVGGGGKKHLHCSLCGHEWAFRRDACPACGNTDHDRREVLFAEDARHERIEACSACSSYLLCVDLREVDGDLSMEAVPLGLVHLDVIAREKALAPMAVMPWTVLDPALDPVLDPAPDPAPDEK
jgi:FdhE protein